MSNGKTGQGFPKISISVFPQDMYTSGTERNGKLSIPLSWDERTT